MKTILPFILLFILSFSSVAIAQPQNDSLNVQNPDSLLFAISDPEILKARMLPLNQLIDSALASAPEIDIQEAQFLAMQADLSSARMAWFNILKFKAGMTTGNGNIDVTDQTVGFQTLSTSKTTIINYGPFLTFSLGELLQNRHKINKAKAIVEQSRYQIEVTERSIRKMVMEQYSELILNAQLLVLQDKVRVDLLLRLEDAKNAYAQTRISLTELLNIEMIYNNQLVIFEKAKSNLNLSFQYLQLITGLRFEQLFLP